MRWPWSKPIQPPVKLVKTDQIFVFEGTPPRDIFIALSYRYSRDPVAILVPYKGNFHFSGTILKTVLVKPIWGILIGDKRVILIDDIRLYNPQELHAGAIYFTWR